MTRVVAAAVLSAAVAATALLLLQGSAALVAFEALLLAVVVSGLRLSAPRTEETDLSIPVLWRRGRPPAVPTGVPPSLQRLQRLVSFSLSTAFDAEYRLRPRLRAVAEERLAGAAGICLSQPEAARSAVGEVAWEVLRRDRVMPTEDKAPGMDPAVLRDTLAALERLDPGRSAGWE
ncbi:MAG: hypothetical protein M3387_03045 [Actinomycetota bacterium]|nr:hypothetical protein [Actinomycetota bacterium]